VVVVVVQAFPELTHTPAAAQEQVDLEQPQVFLCHHHLL
jgi:hypothetical protein